MSCWTGFSANSVSESRELILKMKQDKQLMLIQDMLALIKLRLNVEQEHQLVRYLRLILEGLTRQRIIGTGSEDEIINKHLCDSLYPVILKLIKPGSMLDLGTGAGLPGIPIKICLPEQEIYLMDSNRRKISFLYRVSAELKLERTYCLLGRAEEWGRNKNYRERFMTVVSRAVAATAALAELSLPLTRVGGTAILFKGPQSETELRVATAAITICGGELGNIFHYKLPSGEERALICLNKVKSTPEPYPRSVGMPGKKPVATNKSYIKKE